MLSCWYLVTSSLLYADRAIGLVRHSCGQCLIPIPDENIGSSGYFLLCIFVFRYILSTRTQMCIDYTIVPRASLGREGLCSAIPPVMAARVKYGIGKELAWTNGNKQRAMPSARTCKKSIKLLRFWKYACSSNVSGIIRFIEGHFLVYEVNLQRNYALLSWTTHVLTETYTDVSV